MGSEEPMSGIVSPKMAIETLAKMNYFNKTIIFAYNHRSMNISSLFQQRQLKPSWSYTTSGVLWRLLFSETNFIVGEDRDTATKQVSFFLFKCRQRGCALEKYFIRRALVDGD